VAKSEQLVTTVRNQNCIHEGIKLSPCFLNLAPPHEGVLGERMYSYTHSLTSALDGGEWSASRPGRFTPRKRTTDTRRQGGPQSRSGRGGEEKNSQPPPGLEPPIIQPVAQRYTAELSRLLEGIKSRLNSGNACHPSLQNVSFSRFLF
jgi:hypothetical protein